MEFFKLSTQQTEDKLISREQRIYADMLKINYNQEFTVTTSSKAKYLKIKFFMDAIEYHNPQITNPSIDRFFKVGRYFELECTEQAQHVFSRGFLQFTYTCTPNNNGTFKFKIIPSDEHYILYISSVVFEDSFFNIDNGWLSSSNPNNIIDKIEPEFFNNSSSGIITFGNGNTSYSLVPALSSEQPKFPQTVVIGQGLCSSVLVPNNTLSTLTIPIANNVDYTYNTGLLGMRLKGISFTTTLLGAVTTAVNVKLVHGISIATADINSNVFTIHNEIMVLTNSLASGSANAAGTVLHGGGAWDLPILPNKRLALLFFATNTGTTNHAAGITSRVTGSLSYSMGIE